MFCCICINCLYLLISQFYLQRQETIRQAFVRLDEDIYTMESQCLGPRLATIEAWQQHLLKIKDTQQSANSLASTTTLNDSSDDYQFAPPDDKEVTSERERLAIVQVLLNGQINVNLKKTYSIITYS